MKIYNQRKTAFRVVFFVFLFMSLLTLVVFASEDIQNPKVQNVLLKLKEHNIDTIGSIGLDLLRFILWKVIYGLGLFVDGVYAAINKTFDILTFATSNELTALAMRYKYIYKIILTVTLVGVGLWFIIGNKVQNQLNVSSCLVIMVIIVLGMPTITEQLTALTKTSSQYVQSKWFSNENTKPLESISSKFILDQVVDLNVLDDSISSNDKSGSIPRLSTYGNSSNNFSVGTDEWKYIDITQGMGDKSNDELKNPEIWESYLFYKVSLKGGNVSVRKIPSKFFAQDYYYRYQIRSWFFLFANLCAVAVVLTFALIRLIRIETEVAMAQIYMPLVSVSDIVTGQRIKEALKGFITLFASIFLIFAMFGVYFLALAYINRLDVNNIIKTLFIVGVSLAFIDGSNILEKILGIDLGFKSSAASVMFASMLAMRTAGSLAKGVSKGARGLKKGYNKINHFNPNKNKKMPSSKTANNKGKMPSSNKGHSESNIGENKNAPPSSSSGDAGLNFASGGNASTFNDKENLKDSGFDIPSSNPNINKDNSIPSSMSSAGKSDNKGKNSFNTIPVNKKDEVPSSKGNIENTKGNVGMANANKGGLNKDNNIPSSASSMSSASSNVSSSANSLSSNSSINKGKLPANNSHKVSTSSQNVNTKGLNQNIDIPSNNKSSSSVGSKVKTENINGRNNFKNVVRNTSSLGSSNESMQGGSTVTQRNIVNRNSQSVTNRRSLSKTDKGKDKLQTNTINNNVINDVVKEDRVNTKTILNNNGVNKTVEKNIKRTFNKDNLKIGKKKGEDS